MAVFGSVARGEDDEASDIDFLVEFEPDSSLFDLLHLKDDLEELLGCTVDVVSQYSHVAEGWPGSILTFAPQ